MVGLSKPISWCKQRNGNAGLGYNLTQFVSDTSTHAAYVKSLQPDVIDQVQCLWHMEHVARQTRQMLQSITLMLEVWFQVGSKTLLVLLASFYFSIFLGNSSTLVVVARNLAMLNSK